MSAFQIRVAEPRDVPTIFELIQALAEYEKLTHEVTGSARQLHEHLFGAAPRAEVLLAEMSERPDPVGFALFFPNFSTFLTQPGLYLEDLFVRPEYRGYGVGKALLVRLAQITQERGYGRLEWAVLDWNEPAISFYRRIGAVPRQEWILHRVSGEALHQLAESL